MIVDCHGHYTTAPAGLGAWRKLQVSGAGADWIVDLGPEGGALGGRVVFQGPPDLSGRGDSHTCAALAEFLTRRGN